MKKVLLILSLVFCLAPMMASDKGSMSEPDSLKYNALKLKLREYCLAMEREDLEVQKRECDFIISATEDSVLRGVIAENVYDFYMDSKRMGAEAVAIHVYDKWFADGRLKMSDQIKSLNAGLFADFNRRSLLGCKAPDLKMQTHQGDSLEVFPSSDRRYKVLYFYDINCAKCKVQTMLLRNAMTVSDYPIDFYAIYVGDNKTAWDEYVAQKLNITSDHVRVTHLWDAEINSDFQRKYGVLSSPRLFLVSPDGTIIGRGLDASALSLMLDSIFKEKELVYGTPESEELYDNIFNGDGTPADKDQVCAIIDYISSSTIQKGDTLMFRQMTGDLLYYLSSQTREAYREGLKYLIDENIAGRPDVWASKDDSLKVVGMAEIMGDLLKKSLPGTSLPALKVPAVRLTGKKFKKCQIRLDRFKGNPGIIIFNVKDCSVCAAEKEAARQLVQSSKKVRVLLIDVDEALSSNPEISARLFDRFDLTSLPYIIISDKKGIIQRRYVSLLE